MEICGLCGEKETGRVIEGVPVCDKCFVDGGLNLPSKKIILRKVNDSPYVELGSEPVVKTEDQGFGDYLCPKCQVTHKAGSKVHKRHLKLL